MSGQIITLEEVKILLQISDTSKDELIEALIPIAEDDLFEYTNNDFSEYEEYPPSLKGYLAKMISCRMEKMSENVSSETVSRYSVTFKAAQDINAGYPSSIISGLNKWRKLKWR